ncbi:MAG: polysaccharide pyruvyl transferase family protein [Anaerolineales bacterium]|uniref:polysaccharide pyruvyl transferase family protein n=1 Tax=Candidatus Villigracilis vicinus TaxID=3140679 RepID=UPI0031367E64|nr:polysaccharide pyruvyl transferase family protein [Anaerolineales bacterium]
MKILFLGTHGQFNLGDELLLETFLSQLGEEHTYAVNSYDPAFTQNAMRPKFNVESFHTTRELPRFLKYLLTSKVIFFGGGSIIKELYASVGRNPYSTLLMILATVTFAKQVARKKVIMSNIGVGPLMTPRGEMLARWILSQVDFLSVRDEKSHRTTLKLGLSPLKVNLVPDAVFANPPEVFISTPKPLPRSDKIRIALNLNYDIEKPEAWEPFQANLAASLKELHAATPLEIHALPMQSKFKAHDDLSILKEFSKKIPDIPFILHDPQTAQEAAEIIASVDMVLAERLHTLVISSILGKPFYGLIYDVKVQELVDYLGMNTYARNINDSFCSEDLTAGIRSVLSAYDEIGMHLIERSTLLRMKLGRYFDDLKAKAIPR